MAVINQSWLPQRRLGVWVVAIILITSAYYALWTDTFSVDRFRAGGLSSASSSSQCPEDAIVLQQDNQTTTITATVTHTVTADATNAPAASTQTTFNRPHRDAEYFMDLPSEYELTSEDDDLCRLFYTDEYVYGIANSSKPYCNEGSSVHGFEVPTNPHHKKLNVATPVYLMQGVRWDPARRTFDAQCGDAADMPLVYGSPLSAVSYGAPPSRACDMNSKDRQLIIYPALKETYDNVWHKLMELWQNKLSYDAVRIALDPATGAPFVTAEQVAGALVVFPDDHEGPWDDAWEILTGRPPQRYSELSADVCYDVVVGTVGWGGPFWSALLKTTYETCRRETLMTSFTRWLLAYYGLSERPSSDVHARPTITVVQRGSTRKFRDFELLMTGIHAAHPGYAINVVDLALMTKREQIELLQSTDVLLGHHGAGMSYVMFMKPDAAVVEILPPFFTSRGFRSVARMRGLVHFVGQAMWKEEYQYRIDGVPLPAGWSPTVQGDGDADGWQSEEWIWMTHDEILALVDAAVRSQLNSIGDTR
ncbi:hypothetical protein diail_9031 [Diaporthe ilicicola]|nr:hypothetical protein diail_9031 [Diaporthe ilicicola]